MRKSLSLFLSAAIGLGGTFVSEETFAQGGNPSLGKLGGAGGAGPGRGGGGGGNRGGGGGGGPNMARPQMPQVQRPNPQMNRPMPQGRPNMPNPGGGGGRQNMPRPSVSTMKPTLPNNPRPNPNPGGARPGVGRPSLGGMPGNVTRPNLPPGGGNVNRPGGPGGQPGTRPSPIKPPEGNKPITRPDRPQRPDRPNPIKPPEGDKPIVGRPVPLPGFGDGNNSRPKPERPSFGGTKPGRPGINPPEFGTRPPGGNRPGGPNKPGGPGDPGGPDRPGRPGKPDIDKPIVGRPDPDRPGRPGGPNKPGGPGDPGGPDRPGRPGRPDIEKPIVGRPDPDRPGRPGGPNKPGGPGDPDRPGRPGRPGGRPDIDNPVVGRPVPIPGRPPRPTRPPGPPVIGGHHPGHPHYPGYGNGNRPGYPGWNKPGWGWNGNNHWNQNHWSDHWHDHHVHRHYNGWYHGCWNGHWGGYWNSPWAVPVALGTTYWGWGRVYDWGYAPTYYNPYYDAVALNAAVVPAYDYSQAVVVTNYAPVNDIPLEDPIPEAAQPDPTDADRATQIMEEALKVFKAGQYSQAIARCDFALKLSPGDPVIHEVRALALFAQGEYKPAAAGLNALLAVAPGMDWTSMSSLYPDNETYTKQLRALEAHCRENKEDSAAAFVLAYHYLVLDEDESAKSALKNVIKLQPKDAVAQRLLDSLNAGEDDASEKPKPADAGADLELSAPAQTNLVGKWKAASDETTIELVIDDESNFTWKATPKDQPAIELAGEAIAEGDGLALESKEQGSMAGKVKSLGDDKFQFTLAGAPSTDPGLTFERVK